MVDRFTYRYRRTRSLLLRGLRSLRVRGLKASLAMLSPRLKRPSSGFDLRFPTPMELKSLCAADFSCEQARVSVIIPIHNQLPLTKSCLTSLLNQRGKIAFEVIIVDDQSNDRSFDYLSAIEGLRLFRLSKQSGYVEACNHGAEQARGDFLVFLNNDTNVQAGWLEAMLAVFDDFLDTGIVGAKLLYPNGRLQEAGGAIFKDGSVWNIGRFEQTNNSRFNYVREVDYVSGAALAISRKLFSQLQGFDRHFAPGYFEDADLAMRTRALGYKVRYQPFANVVHLEGGSSDTQADSGMKAFQSPNQGKFFSRWQSVLAGHRDRPLSLSENRNLRFQPGQKKVLVLDEHTPQIDIDSGSLRLYHLMKHLQQENCAVHFLPVDLLYDAKNTPRLQQIGIACHYRPWTKSLISWIKDNAKHFDLIIVCRVSLMHNVYDNLRRAAPDAKIIFDTVDLHHIREEQEAELSKSDSLRSQAQSTKAKEFSLIERCDETWVVSETERISLQERFPQKTIRRISNIHPLRRNTPNFVQRKDLLFVGNFRHPPNQDGLRWFLETAWPMLHSANPDITMNIVGKSAPDYLKKMATNANVVFHGHVADIEKHVDFARINIAPLRYGAGAKGKISQALASGLPTIATSVAANGMHLIDGESVLIADHAELLVSSILDLYTDESRWKALSVHGYDIAEAHFSDHAVAREIRKVFL